MSEQTPSEQRFHFFHSLAFKLSLVIFLVASTLLSGLGIFYIQRFAHVIDLELVEDARTPARMIRHSDLPLEIARNNQAITQLIRTETLRSILIGEDGRVLYSSESELEGTITDVHLKHEKNPNRVFAGTQASGVFLRDNGSSRILVSVSFRDRDGVDLFWYFELSGEDNLYRKTWVAKLFLAGFTVCILLVTVV